jgi:hypothetical protein
MIFYVKNMFLYIAVLPEDGLYRSKNLGEITKK